MEAVANRNPGSFANVHANLSWTQHFKFSHTSNGYSYYTDLTGRYYAHDEAGKWYIQDTKGRFVLWTSGEETSSNTVPGKDEEASTEPTAPRPAVAEEPMVNQCVEMEICDDDAETEGDGPTNPENAIEAKQEHAGPVTADGAGSSGLMADQNWEDYCKQYYQQYGYMPTYETAADGTMGGGQPFSNAGWIVTGGRRTKVRPEDIDLPPGPPPSSTSSNHYAYGLQHYMGYAMQATEDQRGRTASASIVRQLKQFASLKSRKEDGAGDSMGPGIKMYSPRAAAAFGAKAEDETDDPTTAKQEDENANEVPSVQGSARKEPKLPADKEENVPPSERTSLERTSVSSRSTEKSKKSSRKRSRSSSSSPSLRSRSSGSARKARKRSSSSSRNSPRSDKKRPSAPKKRAPSPHFPKLSEENAENVYQPVFVLTTETELPWPASHVRRTKCSPSITYSYTLRGAFKHLLATHRKVREETFARRRFAIEEQLRKLSPSESSSYAESSDSDVSEKRRKRRRRSSSSSRRRRGRTPSGSSSASTSGSSSSSSSSNSSSTERKSSSVRKTGSSSSGSSRRHSRSRSTTTNGSTSATSSASNPRSKKKEESASEHSYEKPGKRSEKIYSSLSSSAASSSTD